MKAILLAAGKGSRLQDAAADLPKPMIEIEGRPVLEHNIRWLREYGVTDLTINLHHRADVVRDYFGDGSELDVSITYSPEECLLGTAGAVREIADEIWGKVEGTFLVVYGDNLMQFDLQPLLAGHAQSDRAATLGVYHLDDVSQSGIVVMAEDGRVQQFIEKPDPQEAVSHWVNTGIYLLEPEVLAFIPSGSVLDFGREVFPAMVRTGRLLYAVKLPGSLIAIDTPELLARARRRPQSPG